MWVRQKANGFTIVELLIVIVVIAILAAVSIVAYNGIQQRAHASSATAALNQASKKIGIWQVDNPGVSPANLATIGIANSDGTYQYSQTNTGTGYCITATSGTVSYYISSAQSGTPTSGGCAGHSANGIDPITNIVANPSFELGTAGWSTGPGSTVVRVATGGIQGSSKMALTRISASDPYAVYYVSGAIPSATYTFSFWAWSDSPVFVNSPVYLQENGGGYRTIVSQTFTTTTTPTLHSLTGTTPSDVLTNLRIVLRTGSSVNEKVYYDGVMVTQGISNYGDGDVAGWVWNGTPHDSTSKGRPT